MPAPAQVVMIIRHAEKPTLQPRHRGVTLEGRQSKDSLTPVGWMRAGALLELFAPREPGTLREGLYRPASLFASNAKGARGGTDREEQTVALLSWKLGLTTNVEHAVGQERELSRAVQEAASPALICWEHRRIPAIAALLGTATPVPERWPNNRYDQVWVLSREDDSAPYAFMQVPELLLPGDSETPI